MIRLDSRSLSRRAAAVLRRLAMLGAVLVMCASAARAADSCDAATGSPPGTLILGPQGQQFRPQNVDCPDDFVAPSCPGGVVLRYRDPQDPSAITRYACAASPAKASKLPLVVFLHPSRVSSVDGVFGGEGRTPPATRLLAQSTTASLAPGTTGYLLLMPQGRCMKSPPDSSGDGSRFDVWYQDPAQNLDMRATLAFIDQLTSRTTLNESGQTVGLPSSFGTFDPKRVYLMSWSNGAFLAHLLALLHPEAFAAAASFAGGDPFSRGPCVTPVPSPARRVPIMLVQAACDPLMFCSEAQAWITTLRKSGWSSAMAQIVITDTTKTQVLGVCDQGSPTQERECPKTAHFTYANGQLATMFSFLKQYTLP